MFNLASHARHYFGAILLSALMLTLGGIYSATRMPSAVYPEVTFSRISVIARKPGFDVPNMQVKVTVPLEEAVSTVIGIAQVRSKTIRGASELWLEFNPGVNMLQAEQFTWNRLGTARSKLPPDVDLAVERMTPSVFPILSLVLTGGDSPAQLRDFAYFNLAPRIKNIPDVLYANVAGGDLREIVVEPRPEALLAAGLSAADLADQIGKIHRLQPVGRIEQPPFAYQVIVNTQSETARDIGNLVVMAKNNHPLLVSELADVRISRQDRVLSIGYQEKDAVVITVFRSPGGNTINVSSAVKVLLDQMEREHRIPHNVHPKVVYDQATFIETAVDNVRDAILVGGLFSILILLGFLRSWRATLISALAIPTTLAITFLFLHWAGETLNLMSLGGLAVAIGLIIDDTVVVIENIARHLEAKKGSGLVSTSNSETSPDPFLTADKAVSSIVIDPVSAASREITGAVVGSTLTTVLVFLPLAFIVGVYGQFFASLSWALSIAVLVSMVISLTLIPVFAAKFLAGRPMPPPGPLYRGLAWLYELVLGLALRIPKLTLTASVAAVGIGVMFYTGIPDWRAPEEGKKERPPLVSPLKTGLMPAMDEGAFVVDYWAPSGTPLVETEQKAKIIEEVLSENPDVDAYVRRTGAELGLFATATNRGDIQVVLRRAEDDPMSLLRKPVRPKFSEVEEEVKALNLDLHTTGREYIREKYRRRSMEEVRKEIQEELEEKFTEHQFKIETVPIITDELNDLSGANKPVEVKLFGPDYHELDELAERVGKVLKELKGANKSIHDIDEAVYAGNPDLAVKIDGVRAARFGLTSEGVERQLNAMFFGQVATQVRESALRMTDVRVRYPDSYRFGKDRFDPQRVLNQWLLLPENAPVLPGVSPSLGHTTGLGRVVPLYALAEIKRKRTTDEQWRENQRPVHYVTAELDEEKGGDLGAVVSDIRHKMRAIPLPPGYSWEMGGHYLQQKAAFKSFAVVTIVAVLLVYIMLVFQFRSVIQPLLIFLTQPLSLVSGLFALWITGTPLNVSSYMGAILLIGLDMKNGILLVEYIQQLRHEGMDLRPALLLAGRTRFRPILMTSLAAILGLAPLALGIGPGAQMQQPLAIMVIGGITANMLFTRMIIPVGYLVLERRRERKQLA
ncbi:MAG: efflux RND transporter permease subunit [Gemmataceae bacterium]